MKSFSEWAKENGNIKIFHTLLGWGYEIKTEADSNIIITFTDGTKRILQNNEVIYQINDRVKKGFYISKADLEKGIESLSIEIHFNAKKEEPPFIALGFP